MNYTPPFQISAKAISMIAEISALIERYAIRMERHDALRLRKANKIKTIQASLAIEGNTLTESQVTNILDGKKVVAPLREIQEVKNAIATYDLAPKLDPFLVQDLLKAHGVMMSALVEGPGRFRHGGVGVFAGKEVVHMAPPAKRVPVLIAALFDWLKKAEDHLLIRSCVFHYEFEFIHPFADGNGRMGRLWQSLILARLHPVFQYLPVESMVHDNQQEYYEAINASTANTNSGIFIDFMLNEILQSLKTHQGMAWETDGGVSGALTGGVNEVLAFIKNTPGCRANGIASALDIPLRSIQRYLGQLKDENKIEFRGAPRNGGYYPRGDK
ncbi:MAG: cell filamentation protein Fic [Lentisphaerae bacterium GWF2_44_16]|nr:MAG: cell filamentation protein Fic [Lentisphaerae bacterium GWF2_44_16]